MSCYFRHMRDIFDALGVKVTDKNKKEVDKIVHKLVGVEYKNCSPTWKEIKARILKDDRTKAEFAKALGKALPKS